LFNFSEAATLPVVIFFVYMESLSLVITLFNEEDNIAPLLASIEVALADVNYEVIMVDDGSTDNTVKNIKEYASERVKLIILTRNFGQTAAMAAGIEAAGGDYIATLDGDLQNDPADIPKLLDKLKSEGWDVVTGVRKNRRDGYLLRKIPSKIANYFIRNLTGVAIHDYGCTLKVFKKHIAKNLGLYGELHRFIPVLAVLQGARITEMNVNHQPRLFGKSKYGLGRTFKVLSDLLLLVFFQKYFKKPIHFFGPLGIISFSIGMVIELYLVVLKIMGENIWGKPLLILGATLILGGIQFLTLGVIAELIMRTYYESQHKRTYNVKEIYSLLNRRPQTLTDANF
jgi:glycosyltransferase involved in cell wall biosynthesis